jgi:Domain of unknown function (DUF4326)
MADYLTKGFQLGIAVAFTGILLWFIFMINYLKNHGWLWGRPADIFLPMPSRIQRRRSRGWRQPAAALYVGRPTTWGNPYKVGPGHKLNGRDLICWCKAGAPCHADVLLAIANGGGEALTS